MSTLLNKPTYPLETSARDFCKDCKYWKPVEEPEAWGQCTQPTASYGMKQIPYQSKGTIQFTVKDDGTVLTHQHYGCKCFAMKDS